MNYWDIMREFRNNNNQRKESERLNTQGYVIMLCETEFTMCCNGNLRQTACQINSRLWNMDGWMHEIQQVHRNRWGNTLTTHIITLCNSSVWNYGPWNINMFGGIIIMPRIIRGAMVWWRWCIICCMICMDLIRRLYNLLGKKEWDGVDKLR